MDREERDRAELELAELAAFCSRRLAHLEARFVTLCARAQALGIECSDLCDSAAPREHVRLVN